MPYIVKPCDAVVGMKINRWTILALSKRTDAVCRCDCGRFKTINLNNVLRGLSKRCRHCSTRAFTITHGHSDAPGRRPADRLYRIWKAMKWRCSPKNTYDVGIYYSRGIRVCDEWLHDYLAFRTWALDNGYQDKLSIDRWPDMSGNYEPSNCRWADSITQARNTRTNHYLTAFGERKVIAAWAEDSRCNINEKALRHRIKLGWDSETAIITPKNSS